MSKIFKLYRMIYQKPNNEPIRPTYCVVLMSKYLKNKLEQVTFFNQSMLFILTNPFFFFYINSLFSYKIISKFVSEVFQSTDIYLNID
jgi:hypothetical protein